MKPKAAVTILVLVALTALGVMWNPQQPYVLRVDSYVEYGDGHLMGGRLVVPGRWRWLSTTFDYPIRINRFSGKEEWSDNGVWVPIPVKLNGNAP